MSKSPVTTSNATLPVIDFQIDIIIQSKLFQTFLMVVVLSLLILMVVKLYQRKHYSIFEWKTVLAFNIASLTEMITLFSTPLPDDVMNYKFFGDNAITDIRILWGIRPKLHIEWRIEIRHAWSCKPVEFQILDSNHLESSVQNKTND